MKLFLNIFFVLFSISVSAADFMPFFNHVVLVEGQAFTVTRFDRGGATKFGVTLQTYTNFCGMPFVTIVCDKNKDNRITSSDLALVTLGDVKPIYKQNYWNVIKGDMIQNQAIAEFITDFVVNSGGSGSNIKSIQRILGTVQDGRIGSNTINAINRQNPKILFLKLFAFRMSFYKKIVLRNNSQQRFLKGWINRIVHLKNIYQNAKLI